MHPKSLLLTISPFALILASSLPAQLQAFGGTGPRMSTTTVFFDQSFDAAGWASIVYGQGTWRDEFDAMAEQNKGKTLRLGKDFWTTLDTASDLTIGGTKLPAGAYYLAVAYSTEGAFSLVALDAAKARAQKLMPHKTTEIIEGGLIKPTASFPMKHGKTEKSVEKLTIELTADKANVGTGTLSISWGPHQLTAAVTFDLGEKTEKKGVKNASGEKGDKDKGDKPTPAGDKKK